MNIGNANMTKKAPKHVEEKNKFQQIYGPETIAAILQYTNKLSPATVKQCDF
jgi:hypothetical protein